MRIRSAAITLLAVAAFAPAQTFDRRGTDLPEIVVEAGGRYGTCDVLKFAPDGGAVRVVAAAESGAVHVDVIDSGPGVPAEECESIFDSFFQGRAQGAGRVAGSGLGLAIAREFVQAHGGAISVVEGEGGHFRVVLPRHAELPE